LLKAKSSRPNVSIVFSSAAFTSSACLTSIEYPRGEIRVADALERPGPDVNTSEDLQRVLD
jgi:hypothetical protein